MANQLTHNTATLPPPTLIIDDKSPHCIPFILARLRAHQVHSPNTPFFIGLNGVQGAGKTTLVAALSDTLREKGLETLVCSIDDLYLKHDDQVVLATDHVDNPLVQHRGEPGTHDMQLARTLFNALKGGTPVQIPQYDKSLFSGHGDRVPSSQWISVNAPGSQKVQVIIFEGWCVGFRSLRSQDVAAKQTTSRAEPETTTLWKHKLEHLEFVNDKLKEYDVITDTFNAFIHIDAEETRYVYAWRLQQEAALRRDKGTGMSDEEVVAFVDGYYPAYEMFTPALREGVIKGSDAAGRQLRLIVGKDRRVKKVVEI